MPSFHTALACAVVTTALSAPLSVAQQLPTPVEISISGAFVNGVAESTRSVLLYDNNLTNGYGSGFDLHDAPAALLTGGPAGSAAFQWGEASSTSSYAHSSALWFTPLPLGRLMVEDYFALGELHYRNGTIKSNTGASAVGLQLTMSFLGTDAVAPKTITFQSSLVNTPNTSNPYDSADIVTLNSAFAPIEFTDPEGNTYFFEMSFQVDSDTMDGTLSTRDQFRVFEGGQGGAVLLGRITTTPFGQAAVPEPSSALLVFCGALLALRRRR